MGGASSLEHTLVLPNQDGDAAQLGICRLDAGSGNQAAQLFLGGKMELVLHQEDVAVRVEQEGTVCKAVPRFDDGGSGKDVDGGFDGKHREKVGVAFKQRLCQILGEELEIFRQLLTVLVKKLLGKLIGIIEQGVGAQQRQQPDIFGKHDQLASVCDCAVEVGDDQVQTILCRHLGTQRHLYTGDLDVVWADIVQCAGHPNLGLLQKAVQLGTAPVCQQQLCGGNRFQRHQQTPPFS